MTMTSTKEKTHENLLRRAALRRGYQLLKCRRRDPRSVGYGLFLLVAGDKDGRYGGKAALAAFDRGEGLTLAEVEHEIGPLADTRSGVRQPRTEMKAGNRYGHWTLMSTVTIREDNYGTMLCRCDCGTEKRVRTQNLRRGATNSCGRCESAAEPKVGDVYGWWTVIEEPVDGKAVCQCRCGTQRVVDTRRLRAGETQSCGCAAKWRDGTFPPVELGEGDRQ